MMSKAINKPEATKETPKFFRIVEKAMLWYTLSGVFVVAGILAILFSGLNWGIDFTGGTALTLQFKQGATVSQIRDELKSFNLESNSIQRIGKDSESTFTIRGRELENSERLKLIETLDQKLGGVELLEVDSIGPAIGKELRQQSLWIVVCVLGLLMVYISLRFELWSGVAAIAALLHDALITIGFVALFRVEVDLAIVVAILTILGYSINDTIVVFDRIRENMTIYKNRLPFADLANLSITQTLARSINTSLTVLLAILALILFGGSTIKGFALVLFVGIMTGAGSSIFIASPVLTSLKKIKL
jgi:preprotein translocase subunit SecF